MNIQSRIAAIGSTSILAAVAATAVLLHATDTSAAAPVQDVPSSLAPSAHRAGGDLRVALESTDGTDPMSSMPAYLQAAFDDVTATWTRIFAEEGLPAPTATLNTPARGVAITTGCRQATGDDTMEYCPRDDSVTFSQAAAEDLWNGKRYNLTNATHGDMGVVTLIAHEYGHNIEAELGLFRSASTADQAAMERGADCLAGVWAADAASRNLLDSGDAAEAYAALDLLAEHPEYGIADHGVHGSPQDRQQAFTLGTTGGLTGCIGQYLGGTDGQNGQQVQTQQPQTQQPQDQQPQSQQPQDQQPQDQQPQDQQPWSPQQPGIGSQAPQQVQVQDPAQNPVRPGQPGTITPIGS